MTESASILRRAAAAIKEYNPAVSYEVAMAADTLEHFDADQTRRLVELDAALLPCLIGHYLACRAQDVDQIAEFSRRLVHRIAGHPVLFPLFEKHRDEALSMLDSAQALFLVGKIDAMRYRAVSRIREAIQ